MKTGLHCAEQHYRRDHRSSKGTQKSIDIFANTAIISVLTIEYTTKKCHKRLVRASENIPYTISLNSRIHSRSMRDPRFSWLCGLLLCWLISVSKLIPKEAIWGESVTCSVTIDGLIHSINRFSSRNCFFHMYSCCSWSEDWKKHLLAIALPSSSVWCPRYTSSSCFRDWWKDP